MSSVTPNNLLGHCIACALIAVLFLSNGFAQQPGASSTKPVVVEKTKMIKTTVKEESSKKEEEKKGEQQTESNESKDDDSKKSDSKEEESKASESVIKRPDKPSFSVDPKELSIKPDSDGRVRFSFHGQPWPSVLRWLAGTSGMSLDWQELPADYLNLTTRRSYSLAEARDIINMHLLTRGYTMLEQGEVLMVVNLKKLDTSLVPVVTADDLLNTLPHAFVKTSFDLPDSLKAESAKADIQAMLSPNGKVFALKATNRLLVIDSVTNLRAVRETLSSESALLDKDPLPRPFQLKHARAEEVADSLRVLLGLQEKQGERMGLAERQQSQIRKLAIAAARKQKPKQDDSSARIVVDRKHNVILVNAQPKDMKIIEQAINILDVAPQSRRSLAGNIVRMRSYRLESLDPKSLVRTLEEIGDLDPQTRMQVDTNNKSIIAFATLADHMTIQAVIDKLDGTGRSMEVIWLRRLQAEEVAGTIKFLFVGDKKDKKNNGYYYDYYYDYPREEESDDGEFRVEPDVENNRLLLYANAWELAEVRKLLKKLGEIPGGASDPRTVRVIEGFGQTDRAKTLKEFQRIWQQSSPNPLLIQPATRIGLSKKSLEESKPLPTQPEKKLEPPHKGLPPSSSQSSDSRQQTVNDKTTAFQEYPPRIRPSSPQRTKALFVQLSSPTEKNRKLDAVEAAATPAPVTVSLTADGRLILSSSDTAALDQAEQLLSQLLPKQKNYEIFYLKNIKAIWLITNLEDYFKEALAPDDSSSSFIRDWDGNFVKKNEVKESRLSKKQKLKFIADFDTNSIMVVNATPEQLKTTRELIKIYDIKMDEGAIKERRTAFVKVKYSSATKIGNAIKEVYRDLLSSKDKAFEGKKNSKRPHFVRQSQIRILSQNFDSTKNKLPKPIKAGFDGPLSLGVDEISNTIVVSAQEEIMRSVLEMIRELDEAARPKTTVRVLKLSPNMNAAAIRRMLSQTVADPWQGGKRPYPVQPNSGSGAVQGQPGNSTEPVAEEAPTPNHHERSSGDTSEPNES